MALNEFSRRRMASHRSKRPAAYEIVFLAFLLLTAGRLIFGSSAGIASWEAGLFLSLSAVFGFAIAQRSSPVWNRYREAFAYAGVGIAYFSLAPVVASLGSSRIDHSLYAWDRDRLGFDIAQTCATAGPAWLTEILSACYALFYGLLIMVAIWCLFPDQRLPRWVTRGVLLIFAIGLIGYTTLPASGPYVFLSDQFEEPLTGGPAADLVNLIVAEWGNKVDVFPSLHTAITLFVLLALLQARPRVGFVSLAPSLGLIVSTIYLRFHYLIDLVTGGILALGLIAWYGFSSKRKGGRATADSS